VSTRSRTKHTFPVSSEPPEIPGEVILEREIPSDAALVTPAVVRTVEVLFGEEIVPPGSREKVQLCLVEALRNAVSHGNRSDFSKKVRLRVFATPREWGFLVEDEGEGFDPNAVPDPSGEDLLWNESGRGLHILRHYMDRVEFFSGGSALLLAKERDSG
jgi:serine/threonine-protein kinase RsbW